MQLIKFDSEAGGYAIRALTTVARAANRGLGVPQQAFLDSVQKFTLESADTVDALPQITPEELAVHVSDSGQALQLVRFMVVACLVDGSPSTQQISLVNEYAAALSVDEPAIGVISHLAKGRVWRFRLAFLRRSHIRDYLRNTFRMSGGSVLQVIKAVLIFRGVIGENRELASRYRALDELPEESLGHRLFSHLTRASLPFPGEHGGLPEGSIYHDVAHVLSGFDTSPEGEMQAAAFQAGFTCSEHDFFTWLFSIVLHTTGVKLLPFPIDLRPGRIGEGSIAMDVLAALDRGTKVNTDLSNQWDFWKYVAMPLEDVRSGFAVLPIAEPRNAQGKPKPGVALHVAHISDHYAAA